MVLQFPRHAEDLDRAGAISRAIAGSSTTGDRGCLRSHVTILIIRLEAWSDLRERTEEHRA
jgi:hypothetical protein